MLTSLGRNPNNLFGRGCQSMLHADLHVACGSNEVVFKMHAEANRQTMVKKQLCFDTGEALWPLPSRFEGRWLSAADGWVLLRTGGLERLPKEDVVLALRACHDGGFPMRRQSNAGCFKFVGSELDGFGCPKEQFRHDMQSGDAPELRVNAQHFDRLRARARSDAIDRLCAACGPLPAEEEEDTGEEEETPASQNTGISALTDPAMETTTASGAAASGAAASGAAVSGAATTSSNKSKGLLLMQPERLDDFLDKLQEHSVHCKHKMDAVSSTKRGCDMIVLCRCAFCKREVERSSGDRIKSPPNKRGPKVSATSTIMGAAFVQSGIRPDRQSEFLGKAGIVAPNDRILKENCNAVLAKMTEMSTDPLAQNRRDHVAAARKAPNCPGDLKFKSTEGVDRSVPFAPMELVQSASACTGSQVTNTSLLSAVC